MSIQHSNKLLPINDRSSNKAEEENHIPYSLLENINSQLKDEVDDLTDVILKKEGIIRETSRRLHELEEENRVLKCEKKTSLNEMNSGLCYQDRNKLAYGNEAQAKLDENKKKRNSNIIAVLSDDEGWKERKGSKQLQDDDEKGTEEFIPPKKTAGAGSLSPEWFVLDIFLRSNKKDEGGRRGLAKCRYCECIFIARQTSHLRDHVSTCLKISTSVKEAYVIQVNKKKEG
jgi:hypothetical protein